jgi:hypothetical protein
MTDSRAAQLKQASEGLLFLTETIVGVTDGGEWAGLSTKLVET